LNDQIIFLTEKQLNSDIISNSLPGQLLSATTAISFAVSLQTHRHMIYNVSLNICYKATAKCVGAPPRSAPCALGCPPLLV